MNDSKRRAVKIIRDNKENLAKRVVEKQYKLYPEYWGKFGKDSKQTGVRDAGFHLNFLTEAINMDDEEIFDDYVKWAKLLFREHNISEETLATSLNIVKEELENLLPTDLFDAISSYIHSGLQKVEERTEEMDSYININGPLGKLASAFNKALLKGNKSKANQMIMDEVHKGTPIKDIYLNVFQPSQLETGRLWLMNQISVAKEHYVSAATQLIMSQLYPYIFSTEKKGVTFVGACVGGELHEIGIRMVGDFFEMDGWDTYYLGANTPVSPLIYAIEEHQADLVGLSISMPYHSSLVKDTISQIRDYFSYSPPKILVGGNGINHKKDIWKYFKADGYAPDAEKAVEKGNQLIQQK
jgi:methanogenic corrinoid protein MtbC1